MVPTFSVNVQSRTSQALEFLTNNDIEPNSFNDVSINERTESEVTKGQFKIEVEENSTLKIANFSTDILAIIEKVENFLQFFCNHCSYEAKWLLEVMFHQQFYLVSLIAAVWK